MSLEFLSSIVPAEYFGSVEPFPFCGRGEVWSWTIVTRDHAPEKFKEYAPYILAIIQLEEGPFITAQLTDLDWHWEPSGEEGEVLNFNVKFGMPVEMVTRKLFVEGNPDRGLIIYGPKFRPPIRPFNGKGQLESPPENSSDGTLPEGG